MTFSIFPESRGYIAFRGGSGAWVTHRKGLELLVTLAGDVLVKPIAADDLSAAFALPGGYLEDGRPCSIPAIPILMGMPMPVMTAAG